MRIPENPVPEIAQVTTPVGATSRDNNFNLIRFILASLVIVGHSGEMIDGDIKREIVFRFFGGTATLAGLAVTGFFLLSGFLIVQSWDRNPTFLDFFRKRALRIYPGFVVASIISVFLVGPLGTNSGRYFQELSVPQFLKDVLLLRVPSTPSTFKGLHYPLVNGSLWTIEYEFRCYMMVALLGICGLVVRRNVWLAVSGATLLLFSVFPGIINRIQGPHLRFFLNDPKQLAHFVVIFGVGGCFYLFRERIHYRSTWALVAALVLFFCMYGEKTAPIAQSVLGGYILFWLAFAQIPLLERFRKYSDISYGVYLYGWPIQVLLLWYIPGISKALLFCLAWPLSCICGLLSWHLVERPFLRLKFGGGGGRR